MNEIFVGTNNSNVQVKPSAPTYNGFQLKTVDGGSGPNFAPTSLAISARSRRILR